MADAKLSALPVVTNPVLAALLYLVQAGVASEITLGNLIQNLPAVVLTNGLTVPSLNVTGSVKQSTSLGARAYHSVAQVITNTVRLVVALDSERYDTDTIHDTVTNNSRLTCKTAGQYIITAHGMFAASAVGTYRQLSIRLNGTTDIAYQLFTPVSSGTTNVSIAALYNLAVNDYVEMCAFQDSGGNLNLSAGGNYSPEFAMARVA